MSRSLQSLFSEMGSDAKEREAAAAELHPVPAEIEAAKLKFIGGVRFTKRWENLQKSLGGSIDHEIVLHRR